MLQLGWLICRARGARRWPLLRRETARTAGARCASSTWARRRTAYVGFNRCCQGNGGSGERGAKRPLASRDLRCKRAPFRQCGRASLFVNLPCDEMPLLIEEIVDLGMN
jgi:hypothetical protein